MNETIGRPVRIASLCFRDGSKSREEIAGRVEMEAAEGVDVIVLPESWPGHDPEPLDGPSVTMLAGIARRYGVYIVCPIDRLDRDGLRWNTAVLIDRQGKVAGTYDKVYPYWSEFDYALPCSVGSDMPVFETDFGTIGLAICFDVNFPGVWQTLADRGAELVIWPSAYSAGASLQAHAINHHFYIVTATATRHCLAFDITGRKILDERGDDLHISRLTLDLDRGIYHQNFNMAGRERLLRERAGDVCEEAWLDDEQWFVLRAKRPDVSARALAREYGLEELRTYLTRSRREIDRMRTSPLLPLSLRGEGAR